MYEIHCVQLKDICTYLGGKIEPSGPVPPKPDGVSGRRAVGLNRKPVTVAFNMGSKVKIGSCNFV